jgi:arylsulfatase A-like enzyme
MPLITARYKLVHYRRRDYGELYDLHRDPYQLRNLYDDPGFLGVRRALEARLAHYDCEEDEVVRERTAPA